MSSSVQIDGIGSGIEGIAIPGSTELLHLDLR